MTHDYIIIGAGSAGSVLASRLSEQKNISVLLLEAGSKDHNPWIHIPIGVGKTIRDKTVNWLYKTQPDSETDNRSIMLPRGKVLGGSSSINGHVVTRGQPEDYDAWESAGNPGWGYNDMLPYFRKIETTFDYSGKTRGKNGPMHVTKSQGLEELSDRLIKAAGLCGIPYNEDPNSGNSNGIGHTQCAIKNGFRVSTAKGYLKFARKRKNLSIQCNAQASKILFRNGKAVGVEYIIDEKKQQASATKEVILCSGAIGSPQLLELSGIGQAKRLHDLGIDVVLDLPGVGENLIDHFLARGAWELTRPISMNEKSSGWPLIKEVFKYLFARKGLLSMGIAHMIIFTRSSSEVERPDLEITVTPFTATKSTNYKSLDKVPGVFLACVPLQPQSRGHVHIESEDPNIQPRISPNYLHAENDRKVTIAGLKLIRRLMKSAAFDNCRGDELWPTSDQQSDEQLIQYARETGLTIHHVVGSCRMGPKDHAGMNVVDSKLKVHGLEGLRIVDASIMPSIISGHTNFPTIALAEKAADIILADAGKKSEQSISSK